MCVCVCVCVCEAVIYHQAGDDDDEDGEEEDDDVKPFSAPHVIPLLALQDVFLQRDKVQDVFTPAS